MTLETRCLSMQFAGSQRDCNDVRAYSGNHALLPQNLVDKSGDLMDRDSGRTTVCFQGQMVQASGCAWQC